MIPYISNADGPDRLRINSFINENIELTIKEGEAIGPYNCSADCNPSCDINWQYTDLDGNAHEVKTSKNSAILKININRTMSLFSCLGTYGSTVRLERNMSFYTQCKTLSLSLSLSPSLSLSRIPPPFIFECHK